MLFNLINKKHVWQVTVTERENFNTLTIEHSANPRKVKDWTLYVEILNHFLEKCKRVIISQLIDEWQQNIDNPNRYANAISESFGVTTTISEGFYSPKSPSGDEHAYVLHVLGDFHPALLEEMMIFGMASLPNIVYGVRGGPEISLTTVLKWNHVMVDWYNLELPDTNLSHLVRKVDFMSWTSDRHLVLGLSEEKVEETLSYLRDLAHRNSWEIDLVYSASDS